MTADKVEANKRPQSAITVIVKGIPTKAKTTQKAFPSKVIGTIFPYPEIANNCLQREGISAKTCLPIVVNTVEQKKTAFKVVHLAISTLGRKGIPSLNDA